MRFISLPGLCSTCIFALFCLSCKDQKAYYMKKFLLFSFLLPFFFSCNKASTPKETAQEFIKALSSSDLTTASNLLSADTKDVLEKARKETVSTTKADECFQFASLTETVSDENAEVKNEVVSIPLVKEDEGWKVVLNESLLNDIQGREEMLATAKAKWETLLKEYEGRLQVLKQYVAYKKSMGALSPKVTLLKNAVESFSPQKAWTRETILAYVQKQQALNKTIDEAMEPSLAANTDLSLNYFVQISNAGDRVKAAEEEYQTMAGKAHSPVYAPLPVNAANPL